MDVEITELFDLDVERHDGVEKPASGFSFLVTKSAQADPEKENPAVEDATKDAPVEPTESAPAETSEAPVEKTEDAPAAVEKAAFDALAERVEKMESALAEADERVKGAEGREAAAKAELEALRATPLPGGPVLAATEQDKVFKAKSEAVKQAAHWSHLAEIATTQEMRMEYTRRAQVAKAEAA